MELAPAHADMDFLMAATRYAARNKSFMAAAVMRDGLTLRHASKELQGDRDLVRAAVKSCPEGALQFASDELKRDKNFLLMLTSTIYDGVAALAFMHEELKSDKAFVMEAIKHDVFALEWASDELKADKEVVLAAVTDVGHSSCRDIAGCALEYAAPALQADREVVVAAVSNNSDAFRYASAALKRDRAFVLTMMREVELAGYALDFVSTSLKADREVVLAAVMSSEGAALELCAEALQADRDFVMDAVAADEHALECATEAMRGDREVVVTAVSSHGLALVYAEDELKADKEVATIAVTQCGRALSFVDSSLRADLGIVLAAMASDVRAEMYVAPDLVKRLNNTIRNYSRQQLRTHVNMVLCKVHPPTGHENGLAGPNELTSLIAAFADAPTPEQLVQLRQIRDQFAPKPHLRLPRGWPHPPSAPSAAVARLTLMGGGSTESSARTSATASASASVSECTSSSAHSSSSSSGAWGEGRPVTVPAMPVALVGGGGGGGGYVSPDGSSGAYVSSSSDEEGVLGIGGLSFMPPQKRLRI